MSEPDRRTTGGPGTDPVTGPGNVPAKVGIGRGTRTAITLGLLLAAVGAAGAASTPWWRLQAEGAQATFTGSESSSGLTVLLVLVVLAGILVLLAAGRRGRRVMGVLLGLLFAAMIALGVSAPQPNDSEVEATLQTMSLATEWTLAATGAAWLYVLAGLLGLVSAVILVVTAGRWPDRSSRYQRTAGPVAADDPEGWWKAMDAGRDPTAESVEEADPPTAESGEAVSAVDPDYPSTHRTGHNVSQQRGGHR
ncbi:Trp biosynthesis-associated membrane protein [Naumannella halotolerans]|uniref:Tryptophan-associated transmembrane protein n=1 Tax=Naumannella halotolerans TaxID=993414 RepID=A0A4R7J8D9_9ACTN|nr:Trp biosynthesis-associated membrane protein [Naumannella halotolerans]TDT33565.1 tryptophan-associated transmembrane protein [Naumannella halotolerans]